MCIYGSSLCTEIYPKKSKHMILYKKGQHHPVQYFYAENAFFKPLLYHRYHYSVILPQRHAGFGKKKRWEKKGVGEVERRYWPAIGGLVIVALSRGGDGRVRGGGNESGLVSCIL